MKIAILGTKGIPNNYGGFEQFAEYLSVRLVERGHEVTVYNPSFHPYVDAEFRGVRIKKIFSPEKWVGGAANFIYDYLCLKDALRQNFDIIYEAGYHSVAYSYKLLNVRQRTHPKLITNMDGLEWMRSKWPPWVQRLIRKLEKIAVQESPFLISDNQGIRQYYLDTFNRDSFFLPYGADPVHEFDIKFLDRYDLTADGYFMLMARMEPENNVEMILEGYAKSGHRYPFVVIGNYGNDFGKKMTERFSSDVKFIGGVYDKLALDALRHFSHAYFHGHSVGGTNPSLLEAMSCNCFVVAHENPFNRGVLGDDASYFSNSEDVLECLKNMDELSGKGRSFALRNFQKIEKDYSWERITSLHESLFASLIKGESV